MEAVGRRRRGAARGPPRKAARRGASPDYWLHTTEDDVLLIVAGAGAGPRRAGRRRRRAPGRRRAGESRAEEGAAGPAPQSAWGERVPPEILERVFRVSVAWEGAVPFLCRVARVCRLWYRAAASPALWQQVSVGFCWVEPGKKQPPATEKRILGTVEWLAASRFSLLRDFTLCHWKSHVPFVLKALGESCPLLASLKLSHCSGVQAESLSLLAKRCPRLESLDLQHSQVDSSAVLSFLEVTGSRLKRLWLTYSSRINAILAMLAAGSCPGLQLLEVNRDIKQSSQRFQLPVEQLQAASPDLQVLRLLNVIWSPKPSLRTAPAALGFPQLEELCLATTVLSFVTDSVLRQLLWASARLRMLDLRGCFRVTPKGLQELPCPDLEQLHLGLYCSPSALPLPTTGSPLLTWKWQHSLQELDLAGQSFSERDLEQALAAFSRGPAPLRALNLTGTKVTLSTVSALILSCPGLSYLNLSSCRHLPRGTKRAYRGLAAIRQCLQGLLTHSDEPEPAQDTGR